MVLLLALIIEIIGMRMMNLKIGALDAAINEFVHITGEIIMDLKGEDKKKLTPDIILKNFDYAV